MNKVYENDDKCNDKQYMYKRTNCVSANYSK